MTQEDTQMNPLNREERGRSLRESLRGGECTKVFENSFRISKH